MNDKNFKASRLLKELIRWAEYQRKLCEAHEDRESGIVSVVCPECKLKFNTFNKKIIRCLYCARAVKQEKSQTTENNENKVLDK